MRQTKQVREILSDAKVPHDFIDVDSQPHFTPSLQTVLGSRYRLPILFVDGLGYVGIGEIREYLGRP